MEPRPILLVRSPLVEGDPGGEVKLDGSVENHLRQAGYIVLHCPAAAMDAFRIVAACPFTKGDVDVLRSMSATVEGKDRSGAIGLLPRDTCVVLASIASRMEAML